MVYREEDAFEVPGAEALSLSARRVSVSRAKLIRFKCTINLTYTLHSLPTVLIGLTENAGHENDGPSKLQDMKLQDKIVLRLHYTTMKCVYVVCCCYFLRHKHYNALFVR